MHAAVHWVEGGRLHWLCGYLELRTPCSAGMDACSADLTDVVRRNKIRTCISTGEWSLANWTVATRDENVYSAITRTAISSRRWTHGRHILYTLIMFMRFSAAASSSSRSAGDIIDFHYRLWRMHHESAILKDVFNKRTVRGFAVLVNSREACRLALLNF